MQADLFHGDGTHTLTEQKRLLRICDLAYRMGLRALGIGDTSNNRRKAFVSHMAGMKKTLRGRSRLNLDLAHILEAVRRHRQVVAAARELRCSDAYIHVRLKGAGLTLAEVLEAPGVSRASGPPSPPSGERRGPGQ